MVYYITFYFCFFLHQFLAADLLTLEEAQERALNNSPKLQIAAANIAENKGSYTQSCARLNPLFSVYAESYGRDRRHHHQGGPDVQYELSQPVELGNKRCYRMRAASSLVSAAEAEYEVMKYELLSKVRASFVKLAALQERMRLAELQKKTAEEFLHAVDEKVLCGKLSGVKRSKAEIAHAHAEISHAKVMGEYLTEKERLSILMGNDSLCFDGVCYPFFEISPLIDYANYLDNLESHPELLRANCEWLAAKETIGLEKANAIPDVVVSVGYQSSPDPYDRGFIVGATVPLPIFNQNRGNIASARASEVKQNYRYEEIYLSLKTTLSIAYRELCIAYDAVKKWENCVLKATRSTFECTREAYQAGKLDYLEMLDAQQVLFEAEQTYITTTLNYHLQQIQVDILLYE